MKSTWRFVLMIVGLSLAAAGTVCLIVASWDKLAACAGSLCKKRGTYPEFDDYDDDSL